MNTECLTCKSKGFAKSVLGEHRCTFCDGTEGSNPPTVFDVLSELQSLATKYPSYRIVTDVGMSACSGWGDLKAIKIAHDCKAIELIFE